MPFQPSVAPARAHPAIGSDPATRRRIPARPPCRGTLRPRFCLRLWLWLCPATTLANLFAFGAEGTIPPPPGIVIAHQAASTRQYLGSPSITVAAPGHYLASHDLFGPGASKDTTRVFESLDAGEHWKQLSEIKGQWWSTLFTHAGHLYLLGTSRQDGDTVIRRSTDGGHTWSQVTDRRSGLLLGEGGASGGYHCAPVPVVIHAGRIWRAMEDTRAPGGWGRGFRSFVMSCPTNADLLQADSWTHTAPMPSQTNWAQGRFGGWLEGNVVIGPGGGVWNVLRVHVKDQPELAAMIRISPDGGNASFDPDKDLIPFPGGCKKFLIRPDLKAPGTFWAMANYVPPNQRDSIPERTRNTLALLKSTDLRTWTVRAILLKHPDKAKHGFQYPDWQFEGEDDIVAAVRTAWDDAEGGAHSQHDANYITFHRFKGFRQLSAEPEE